MDISSDKCHMRKLGYSKEKESLREKPNLI